MFNAMLTSTYNESVEKYNRAHLHHGDSGPCSDCSRLELAARHSMTSFLPSHLALCLLPFIIMLNPLANANTTHLLLLRSVD
jgi:hypothetical protein